MFQVSWKKLFWWKLVTKNAGSTPGLSLILRMSFYSFFLGNFEVLNTGKIALNWRVIYGIDDNINTFDLNGLQAR